LEKECKRNEKEAVQGGQGGSEEECLGTEKECGTEAGPGANRAKSASEAKRQRKQEKHCVRNRKKKVEVVGPGAGLLSLLMELEITLEIYRTQTFLSFYYTYIKCNEIHNKFLESSLFI
jgi:hypothetical protein